ncbi:MAG: MFS transporter [Treponema sp.]|jgi:MFS family permease|nr:MFS transporter [Treponema sp.]
MNKQLTTVGLFGLYFACLLQGGTAVLGPAVNSIAGNLQIDPSVAAQVGTFGSLFGIISSFLAGRFAGKIKYKTFLLVSLIIFIAGGSIPVLIPTWSVILFSRACVGFGVGVFYALPPALIMKSFSGGLQQKKLGMANAFGSAGGLIMQFVVGVLAAIKWNYVFSIFTIGIVAFFLIAFGLNEPEEAPDVPAQGDKPKAKANIHPRAWLNFIFVFVAGIFWMPSLLFVSIVVEQKLGGTPVHSGIVAPMFNVAAVLLSFAFAFLYKTFKKFLAVFILLLVTVGMFLEYNAVNLVMVGAGLFLTGAFLLMIPTLLSDNGKIVAPESLTFATSLLIIAMNVAGFVAGPFVGIAARLATTSYIPGLYLGIIGQAAVVVIFFIIRLVQKDAP